MLVGPQIVLWSPSQIRVETGWVILSFNWFLAAGLKWSTEAIAGYTAWFHFFAWALPAVLTISVLSTSSVDGDPFAGVCYVGNTDINALRLFVLSPLFTCLLIGSFFLLAGFVSLFRIRNLVKNQRNGVCRIEKLEKLMVRIGIFSVLYTVPATVVLACHFYEQYYRRFWEASAVCRGRCFSSNNVYNMNYRNSSRQSEYFLFIVKYFTCLLVGISSGIWIWTKKTWSAWKNFLATLVCCCSEVGTTAPAGYSPAEAIIIKSHTDLTNGLYSKHYHPINRI
uniref:G-protein coupled receptors family 2 profile 2 domain-containing protein n=1 Tax=Romanomermis culicivorax TaxID=13658 RepID=A0A915K5Q9_ROMCU